MRVRHGFFGLIAFSLVAGQVFAQAVDQTSFLFRRPAACDNCATPVTGPLGVAPTDPSKNVEAPMVDPQAFAQAPAAGGEAGLSFNPAMFGDLGTSGLGRVSVRTTTVTTIPIPGASFPPFTTTIVTQNVSTIQVPIIGAGSFKISDNESPRPTDRVFFTYNYFDRVNAGAANFGLHRELIGFEKTFLDGNASFGLRLPFMQTTGAGNLGDFANHEVGDITLIGKYALVNDRETGNVLSGGLALTVPTADHSITLADGSALRSVLFQPYVGWILGSGSLYAHGFHAVVVPTDSRDVTTFDNDIGVGYWAYRNPEGFLRGIVPTFEGHLYTPLNHTNRDNLVFASDILTLTTGVNFVMPGNSTLAAAVATPVTGPRPNNVEAIVSLNVRF